MTTDLLWHDSDAREELLRSVVADRLAASPPPQLPDHIVATYFLALRSLKLEQASAEIAYHATSGTRNPPPGSLLEECTARLVGVNPFDNSGRLGLLHIAFPLKMMLQPDGHLTSTDIYHTVANAILFDVYEHQDCRLLALQIPESAIRTFPGPAWGPLGMRERTGFAPDQPAFGTILKPTAGITSQQVAELVAQAAQCPLFMFVKEDENLYPNLAYCPIGERARLATEAIARAQDVRGGLGLIFAPHVTSAPHEILGSAMAALEAGATGLMFSESFAGGIVRMVREATKDLPTPPAIYGHNAGIGVKTRGIWREGIDLLARLDGIDFRQTAPLLPGTPFLKPYGAEWLASESVLAQPLPGIKPTMIVRAGGLDQGNIGPNLADVEARGLGSNVLFLAGSAINSVKGADGKPDPRLGAQAMQEAVAVHQSGALSSVLPAEHTRALLAHATTHGLTALASALYQRYPTLSP